MEESRPGGTALLITVSPVPGKYDEVVYSKAHRFSQTKFPFCIRYKFFKDKMFFRCISQLKPLFYENKKEIHLKRHFFTEQNSQRFLLFFLRFFFLNQEQYVNETILRFQYLREHFNSLDEIKRLPMEVVQYHGNLRAQVSKLSLGPSLSKISLIFWTCCAGRIRY